MSLQHQSHNEANEIIDKGIIGAFLPLDPSPGESETSESGDEGIYLLRSVQ